MAYLGTDFSPMDVGETEVFGIDFANALDAGETIDTVLWICSDETLLQTQGLATHSGSVVSQKMTALAVGTVKLECFANTSAGCRKHLYANCRVLSGSS